MASINALSVALFNAAAGGYTSELTANGVSIANAVGPILEKDISTNALFVEHLLSNFGVASTNAVYAEAKAALTGLVTTKGRLGAATDAIDYLKSQEGTNSPFAAVANAFAAKVATATAFSTANPNERDITKLIGAVTGTDTDVAAINAAVAAQKATDDAAAAVAAAKAAADLKAAETAAKTAADLAAMKASNDLAAAKNAADLAAMKAANDLAAAKNAADLAALKAANDLANAEAKLAAVDNTAYASEQAAADAAKAAAEAAAKTAADVAAAKAANDLSAAQAQVAALQQQVASLTVTSGFTLTANAPTVTEGDTGSKNLTFILTLDKAPTSAVSINYQTLDTGTATAGDDFEAAAGVVTFAAGQTFASVTVAINGDTSLEGDETVAVQFSGAALKAAVTAAGTIRDNEVAVVDQTAFTVSAGDIATANAQNVPVTLNVGNTGAKTVTIQSDGARANAGVIINGDSSTAITSGASADIITVSGNGNNTITTGAGSDTVSVYGSGNNTINVGAGSDTVNGGTGDDTIVFASGALGEGDFVTGGSGVTTIRISGDGNVIAVNAAGTGAVLSGVEKIVLDGTTLTIDAQALIDLIFAGLTKISGHATTSDLVITGLNSVTGALLDLSTVEFAGGFKSIKTNGTGTIVLTTAQAAAVETLAAATGTLTQQVIVQGAQTVAEGVALIAAGVTASFALKDTAANLALAPVAVFNKAVSIEATTVATAAQAAEIAAIDTAATGFTATATNLKYSVSDTASMLANYSSGLANATTVTATTNATVAEAAAIRTAAAGGVTTTAVYAVNDTVAAVATGVAGAALAALDSATSITVNDTVTDVANITTINTTLNGNAGGLTKIAAGYAVSDSYADITGANVAVSNAAGKITVTDTVDAAKANAIEALTNTGVNSYAIEDTIGNVLGTTSAVVSSTSAASTSASYVTVSEAIALVNKYGSTKVVDSNLVIKDTAENLLNLTASALAEAISSNGVEVDGVSTVAQALSLKALTTKLKLSTVAVSDSAAAIKAAVAVTANLVIIDKFDSVTVTGTASVADVDTINQALAGETTGSAGLTAVATGYLLSDTAAKLTASTTTRESAIVAAASKVTVTGTVSVADLGTITTRKTGSPVLGTDIVYTLSDTASNVLGATSGQQAGASSISITDESVDYTTAASVKALTKFDGVYKITDTVSNLYSLTSDANKVVLNGAVSVTLKDSASALAGSNGITARALSTTDLVTLEDAFGTVIASGGAINTANVPAAVLADVDAVVLTNVTGSTPLILTATDVGTGLKTLVATGKSVTYTIYDSASNLMSAALTADQKAARLNATKVYVDADGNGTLDSAITVADFNTIDANTNGKIYSNLTGTIATLSATNASTAISTRIANSNTVTVTDYSSATATAAQANTLSSRGVALNNSTAYIDVVDTAANISTLSDAVWTTLIAQADGTVTVSDNGTLTLTVARANEVYDNNSGTSGSKYGNFVLVDTAANLAAANAGLVQTALSATATDAATLTNTSSGAADTLGAMKVAGFGSIVYDVSATAANLAASGNAVGTNNAQNLTATTAATLAEGVNISALTNTGTKTYNLTDSASNIAAGLASSTPATAAASLRAVNAAGTIDATLSSATATGAEATTLSGIAKAVKYNISDSATNLAATTVTAGAFNEANNITVTGTGGSATGATLAAQVLGATNTGTTTIAEVSVAAADAKALVIGSNDTITQLTVSGTTTATDAIAIAALDTGSNVGTLTFNKITGTAEELISAGTTVLNLASAVSGTTSGVFATTALTVAQKNTLGSSVDSYSLTDTFANLMANTDVTSGVDADAAMTAATTVTVLGDLTLAQVASLKSVSNSPSYVYSIVDNDANIVSAMTTSATTQGYLSGATSVTANAGTSLKFALVGSGSTVFGITGTKAELSALSTTLKAANLIYTADVATLNADLTFYSSLPANAVVSVTDTYANLTSGNAAVGAAKNIKVTGDITLAQATTVAALAPSDTTVYSLSDTAANLTAGGTLNGAVNVTATNNATFAQSEVIEDATNSGTATYSISDTDGNITTALSGGLSASNSSLAANKAQNIAVTGATGISATDAALVLSAAKGTATISKVTGTASAISGLTLAAGDSIALAAVNSGTATVADVTALKAKATSVTYNLTDTAAKLALADAATLNGATNIVVNETNNAASIALAVAIDAATNTGTNTYSILDSSANVLAATATQLQLDTTILINDTFVSAETATALRAKDAAVDTQSISVTIAQGAQTAGQFIVKDTVANLTNAANADAVTNAHAVTVTDTVVTVAQAADVIALKSSAVYNVTDTYANINNNYIASSTGAAAKAVDLTVTGTITVSQANNIVNTIGAANSDSAGKEIFTIRDTANNVANNAALSGASKIVDDAASIQVTGTTTVARAGYLSELTNLTGKYAISDTAANVSTALNTFNSANAADRATVLGASAITLTDDATVAQAAGTSTAGSELLGLYKVPGVSYNITDSASALVTALAGPDASALTSAGGLWLDASTAITVSQADTLTALSNFKGYDADRTDATPGVYNLSDTATAILGASYDLLAKAGTVTATGHASNADNIDFSGVDRKLIIDSSGGADIVVGTNYADTITGGAGADNLTGGDGADIFVFSTASNSVVAGFDLLQDFTSGSDKIKTGVTGGGTSLNQGASYTAAGTGTLATDIASAVAAGNTAASTRTAGANDLYVVTITGTGAGTYIFQDTNGGGTVAAGELVIQLVGTSSATLISGDFIA